MEGKCGVPPPSAAAPPRLTGRVKAAGAAAEGRECVRACVRTPVRRAAPHAGEGAGEGGPAAAGGGRAAGGAVGCRGGRWAGARGPGRRVPLLRPRGAAAGRPRGAAAGRPGRATLSLPAPPPAARLSVREGCGRRVSASPAAGGGRAAGRRPSAILGVRAPAAGGREAGGEERGGAGACVWSCFLDSFQLWGERLSRGKKKNKKKPPRKTPKQKNTHTKKKSRNEK